ncbi:MAG: right-handed parallel beta-helix repeat-containing protein [Spirochaetia bacterium]|nr:right-handed parallel beta-helix repeat-containing protein [Spirochaetia bacterium]
MKPSPLHSSRIVFKAFFFAGLLSMTFLIAAEDADPLAVHRLITEAIEKKQSKVVIPPGVYRLGLPASNATHHLSFTGLTNFEIDARGANFVFTSREKRGMVLDHCSGLVFRGAVLERDPVPFSQGKILDAAPDRKSVEIEIAAGYPDELGDTRYFGKGSKVLYLFDPKNRLWKKNTTDLYYDKAERLGPGRFRVSLKSPIAEECSIEKGDLFATRGNGGADLHLRNSDHCLIEDLTIRSGSGFCLHEDRGEGANVFRRYRVTFGKTPAGASESPLIACNADAFHSSGVRVGPKLLDCFFEGMCDDGIAIHGGFSQLERADGKSLVINTRWPEASAFWRPGDTLKIYSTNLSFVTSSVIKAVRPVEKFQPSFVSSLGAFKNLKAFAEVETETQLAVEKEMLVCNTSVQGAGFEIRNCRTRNHRARGIIVKADNGLIEGCTIEGTTMAAILVTAELYWAESDFSKNLVIRNNTFRQVATALLPWNAMIGAVTVAAQENGRWIPTRSHEGIRIENNTFDRIDGVQILVSSSKDVKISGNVFQNPQIQPSTRGRDKGIDPEALFYFAECEGVTLENNQVAGARTDLSKKIVVLPTASVSGMEHGLRLSRE